MFFGSGLKFNFGSFVGWGLTTLALRFLNKRSSSDVDITPDDLSVSETKLGTPIPVVLGKCIIKAPLTSYYGDFDYSAYTEEYSAHASFNAWPLVLSLIATYIATAITGHTTGGTGMVTNPQVKTTVKTSGGGGYGEGALVSPAVTCNPQGCKDDFIGPLLNTLFMWLLSWLINGRNLKTTIQKGFKYYLGYQQILCWSDKTARLRRVWMNEKLVWQGDEPMYNHLDGLPFVINVNDENLFGGPDENGGFSGSIRVYFGSSNQKADDWMIKQMSASSVQEELRGLTPAYRGYISVVVPKSYIGKRSTIPTMWYEIQTSPESLKNAADESYTELLKGISSELGYSDTLPYIIGRKLDDKEIDYNWLVRTSNDIADSIGKDNLAIDEDTGEIMAKNNKENSLWQLYILKEIINILDVIKKPSIGEDCNPANILAEIVGNDRWGIAEKYSVLNLSTLAMIAVVLEQEQIGLSVLLNSKEEAASVIDKVCEHINAFRYIDERYGNMAYRLVRPEHNGLINTVGEWNIVLKKQLLEVTEDNCSRINFVRQDWSNTISEVSINYTDRDNLYETSTVTADDMANVEIQNGIRSIKSYDMPYFTTSANALWAAKRLMEAEAYPLANFNLELNRHFFEVRLGDILLINFPLYGVNNMIVRVNNVSHAEFETGTITIDAIEDIFALSKTEYNYSDMEEWQEEKRYPTGAQYFAFYEIPYEMTRVYQTYVYAFCSKPDKDTVAWDVWRKKEGAPNFSIASSMSKWSAVGKFVYGYAEDTDSVDRLSTEIKDYGGMDELFDAIMLNESNAEDSARNGLYIAFAGNEIISFSSIEMLANKSYLLKDVIRGTFDTVPEKHEEGAVIFFYIGGHFANVAGNGWICKKGKTTTEQYNITTKSVDEEEEFDDLKVVEFTSTRRADRPSVMGNVRLTANALDAKMYPKSLSGDMKITWTARNKKASNGCVAQTDETDFFSGAEFTLDENCIYLVDVYVGDEVVKHYEGTEAEFTMTWLERCNLHPSFMDNTEVMLYTEDTSTGLRSYQKQKRVFNWKPPYVVGMSENETIAAEYIKLMDEDNKIRLPHSDYNEYALLEYTDMPVILIGTKTDTAGEGVFIDRNGEMWKPNGTILAFSSKNKCETVTADNGYIIYNPFRNLVDTNSYYFKWENGKFISIEVK